MEIGEAYLLTAAYSVCLFNTLTQDITVEGGSNGGVQAVIVIVAKQVIHSVHHRMIFNHEGHCRKQSGSRYCTTKRDKMYRVDETRRDEMRRDGTGRTKQDNPWLQHLTDVTL